MASSLTSAHALQLLERAEAFVRSSLPCRTARRQLARLLQVKANLPADLRGTAVKDLLGVLVNDSDDDATREFLSNFEDWDVMAHLDSCSDQDIARFQEVARASPMLLCHESLDKLLARRLAAKLQHEGGAASLWLHVQKLASDEDRSDQWMNAAALVLSAAHEKIKCNLADLSEDLLTAATEFLRDPARAVTEAERVYGCDLGLKHATGRLSATLAAVLLERARRCDSASQDREDFLAEAWTSDSSNHEVRGGLLKLLLIKLEAGGPLEKEGILLELFFAQHRRVPDRWLSTLPLADASLQTLGPRNCMTLAEQLAEASRRVHAAKIAVFAAKAFDDAGDKDAAQKAYIRAYDMDRTNQDASHGVVESCCATRETCLNLQREIVAMRNGLEEERKKRESFETTNQELRLKLEAKQQEHESTLASYQKRIERLEGFMKPQNSKGFSKGLAFRV